MSKSKWMTPELKKSILARCDGTVEAINQLMEDYGVPKYTIVNFASKNGLTKKKSPDWTENEEEFLANNWHKGIQYCSKKLKRTDIAVNLKAKRIGLGGCVSGSHYLTGLNVANIMGIDIHVVLRWLNNGLLKNKLAPFPNRKIYLIDLSDLESFLQYNLNLWDSRKMKGSLWIKEPEWFRNKKTKDKLRPINEGKKYTKAEDKKIIDMFKTGDYTYQQIGESVGRSLSSVEHRLNRLDVWGNGLYNGK
jgi:hypothetical protein